MRALLLRSGHLRLQVVSSSTCLATFDLAGVQRSYAHSFRRPGKFIFPPPYNTEAFRITDASDCGGTDCVTPVGYSYWRNSNAHEGGNDMWIFLSLNSQKGGSGPTLFRLTRPPTALQKSGRSFPQPASFPAEVVMAGTSAPAGQTSCTSMTDQSCCVTMSPRIPLKRF